MLKSTVKIGISEHCYEQPKGNKYHFEGLFSGIGVISWAKCKCENAGTEAEHQKKQIAEILWFDVVFLVTQR